MSKAKDFLHQIVEEDLKSGKYKEVHTRFPPEPNGFPHIGHAKSIVINFGLARDYNGKCNLRMDDTDPTKEDPKYVKALQEAVEWLGFKWDGPTYYTSDYFPKLYEYAVELIKMGKAYVDSVDEEMMRELRGTITEPGRRSEYAKRSIEENLDLFERMKKGEFKDGEHVLRAKIDMSSPNMKMRDPILYRIRNVAHYRVGDEWHIYPMYDFAHPLSDYIEGITHSICTLEFENNREIYDWLLDTLRLGPPRPYQHEFARLAMTYTVMSKRKLLELVESGAVSGWDDPRLPTIAGYKRRGYTPESIINFCEQIGVSKANSVVDVAQLEHAIRDDLNTKAPRVMAVFEPLKITIENYEGSELLEAPYYPHDVAKEGSRKLPFSKEIYIERSDFEENPPKGYYRLTPNQPVRLKHAYIIECTEVIKDSNGNIVEIKAKYFPNSKSGEDKSGIKVKSAIQWVDAKEAKRIEVRLYDRLYRVESPEGMEDLNPNSLKVIQGALVEPSVVTEKPDLRLQFERHGYFYIDPVDYSDEHPVFNLIVPLKDSWAKRKEPKKVQRKESPKEDTKSKNQGKSGEMAQLSKEEQSRFEAYQKEYGLNAQTANILAREKELADYFLSVLEHIERPVAVANIVTNFVARELKEKSFEELEFTPADIAELVAMVEEGIISTKIAKEVFEELSSSGKSPKAIVQEKGLVQISDPEVIVPIIDEVIAKNPENVKKYKEGNSKLFGFFVGQVLKATGGKANPQVVNKLLKERL